MFFKNFTPLIGTPDKIRAGRIYPGGKNLDKLIGKKTNPEENWFYPEAWIFSPKPAINPGSKRTTEGQTIIYDKEGNTYNWYEYTKINKDVLGDKRLNIKVKMLDGECTLPKEFHFRIKDEKELRKFPLMKDFKGTIIKPEVWIRYPKSNSKITPAFIGFNKMINQETFAKIVKMGVEEIEKIMNKVTINPGEAIYVAGGTVHSLGKGLYFEVLADGDLKVTLQKSFAGKGISMKEQLNKIYTGGKNDFYNALKFIDYTQYGEEVVQKSIKRPKGEEIQEIIKNNYFSAYWLRIKPGNKLSVNNNKPCILVTANGEGIIKTENAEAILQTKATTFEEFKKNNRCYALIMHCLTKKYTIENNDNEELIILQAYGK